MYSIFCDSYLLHSDTTDNYKVVNPKLELELNKAGKLTFTIYPNHPYYSVLKKMISVITVYQNNEIIFRGRILESEQLWLNQRNITCEGELAFLNDSILKPYDYSTSETMISVSDFFKWVILSHNAQVDEYKQFKIGKITVPDDKISRSNEDYSTVWNTINDKLISYLGGYLIIRHESDGNYIDYLDDLENLSSQIIQFGSNLLDINQTISGDEIVTGIIPLGAKDDDGNRITIESVNDGKNYLLNETQAGLFGKIFQTVVWDDITIVSNLYKKAIEYVSNIGALNLSIEVNAVDIAPLNSGIESFRLGTKVKVQSFHHGIDEIFRIEKLSLELSKPESNKLTLNSSRKTLTEQNSTNTTTIQTINETISSIAGTVEKTSKESSVIIWTGSSDLTASINLNRSISSLLHGIVLIFKHDTEYISCFVSKESVGTVQSFMLSDGDIIGYKIVTVGNYVLTGSSTNKYSGNKNGITYNNHLFVLSSVIGI